MTSSDSTARPIRLTSFTVFKKPPPERAVWAGMRSRCLNPNDPSFQRYGGRGITICERWRSSFRNFLADVGPRPGPEYSIDRVDNDGNYEPGNCRWATKRQQARNTRSNSRITFRDETRTLAEWSEVTGISYRALVQRLGYGWSIEDVLTRPRTARKRGRVSAGATARNRVPATRYRIKR